MTSRRDGISPVVLWITSSLLAVAMLRNSLVGGFAIALLGGIAVGLSGALEAEAHLKAEVIKTPPSSPRRSLSRWLINNELWLVLLLGPLFLFPEPAFTIVFPILPILWILRWRIRGRLTKRTALDWPILFIMVMLPISVLASADVGRSIPELGGILFGVGVFYAMVNRVRSEQDINWMAAGLIVMGVVAGVIVLLGTNWANGKFVPDQIYSFLPRPITNIPGTLQGRIHPNRAAGGLAFLIPLLTVILVAQRHTPSNRVRLMSFWGGRGLAIPLVFISVVLILTQSRSALFGVGVSLLVFFVTRSRLFRWALLGISIGFMAFLLSQGFPRSGDVLVNSTGEDGAVMTLDFTGRQEVWQHALYALQDFPFTGVGLNMFDPVSRSLYPYSHVSPDMPFGHAHNIYLQVAADLGIPGLVAYLALLSAFGYVIWKILNSDPSSFLRAVALGLGLGVVAHQVFGLTDAVTLGAKSGIILWAMLALAVAIWQRQAVQCPTLSD